MSGILNVNLWRWDEKIDMWEGSKQYMYQKSSPLFHTKVPKIEPILLLLKSSFISYPIRIPPTTNCYVPNIYLFQRNDIFIFITQCPMFFSHLWFDMSFCVFVQGMTLVKKTSSLSITHRFVWIFVTLNSSNCIAIGLSAIGHESFEVWIGNTIFHHHLV